MGLNERRKEMIEMIPLGGPNVERARLRRRIYLGEPFYRVSGPNCVRAVEGQRRVSETCIAGTQLSTRRIALLCLQRGYGLGRERTSETIGYRLEAPRYGVTVR